MKDQTDTCSVKGCTRKVSFYRPDGRMFCAYHNEATRYLECSRFNMREM